MDYREYVKKEKKGYAFKYKNALIEVSNIKNLGDFIEIEFLNNEESIENQIKESSKIKIFASFLAKARAIEILCF